jgi:nicotinate-nucleotide adenylyltransferase
VLIAGTDIFPTFHKWKNYQELIKNYKFYIYNRPGYDPGEYASSPNIHIFEAPLMEISSSFIRQAIADGRDIRYFVPDKVYHYIQEMHFYEQ